jgi:UDP-N-acetyl-D-mannosaminuronate dehydrogenase
MELIDKIKNRSAVVGVVGLGYVGLPLIIEFGRAGFSVIGFDNDEKKIKNLSEGRSYPLTGNKGIDRSWKLQGNFRLFSAEKRGLYHRVPSDATYEASGAGPLICP